MELGGGLQTDRDIKFNKSLKPTIIIRVTVYSCTVMSVNILERTKW